MTISDEQRLKILLQRYEKGFYTELEIPSKILTILKPENCDTLWNLVPQEIQLSIINNLSIKEHNTKVKTVFYRSYLNNNEQNIKLWLINKGII